MLAKDKCVRGVEVPGSGGRVLKVIGYMDDVTVVCKDMVGLRRVRLLIEIFCMASGFCVNIEKSECKLFGVWGTVEQCGWKFCVGGLRILGVKFDGDLYGRESWQDVLARVKKKVDFWSLRTLSMEGKVLVVKAVVIPILLFLYYVFPAPDRMMKQIV